MGEDRGMGLVPQNDPHGYIRLALIGFICAMTGVAGFLIGVLVS